ncbi:hypothetical protein [Chitinimonas lacunae]|uniref:Uncharacterized protein n=1 Tax=Chitinimonas lacunae TaxID=1963018 RepID=A0ABV8MMK2_9NEIS
MTNDPNTVVDSRSRDGTATYLNGLQGGVSSASSEGQGRSRIGDAIESGRGAAPGQYGVGGQYPATRSDAMVPWHDPHGEVSRHFQRWRTEQLSSFDRDYADWRQARDRLWLEEFEQWRSRRPAANPGTDHKQDRDRGAPQG